MEIRLFNVNQYLKSEILAILHLVHKTESVVMSTELLHVFIQNAFRTKTAQHQRLASIINAAILATMLVVLMRYVTLSTIKPSALVQEDSWGLHSNSVRSWPNHFHVLNVPQMTNALMTKLVLTRNASTHALHQMVFAESMLTVTFNHIVLSASVDQDSLEMRNLLATRLDVDLTVNARQQKPVLTKNVRTLASSHNVEEMQFANLITITKRVVIASKVIVEIHWLAARDRNVQLTTNAHTISHAKTNDALILVIAPHRLSVMSIITFHRVAAHLATLAIHQKHAS